MVWRRLRIVCNREPIARRRATESDDHRPSLSAFLLPLGAPGDLPPCMRHLPFGIAGDWHGLPFLVRAPQRGLWCMGNLLCMGLILCFCARPPGGLDHPHNCLATGVDMHVLDGDLLLALPAMPVECFK